MTEMCVSVATCFGFSCRQPSHLSGALPMSNEIKQLSSFEEPIKVALQTTSLV